MTDASSSEHDVAHPEQLPSGARSWVVAAAAIGAGVALALEWSLTTSLLLGWALLWIVPIWSAFVEGRRMATQRLADLLVGSAFAAVMLPLASILWTVVSRGSSVLSAEFMSRSMTDPGGGIYHAIVGSLLMTSAAAVVSIPIGVLGAIHLVEYAAGTRLGRWAEAAVDTLIGLPGLVAGLFAYALMTLFLGEGARVGMVGAIALSVLLIPVIVRSTQAALMEVPDEVREASYALGGRRSGTILKIIVPAALPGIVAGIVRGVARVLGEAAPLLLVAGAVTSVNVDLLNGSVATLPTFIFTSLTDAEGATELGIDRACGAALVLVLVIALLNVVARVVDRRFSPVNTA